jgi:outer membrane immunogenic protein
MFSMPGKLTLAVFAAVVAAVPAGAQTTTAIPPKAYGPVWTGFYVGAAFGGGALVNKVNSSAGGATLNVDGLGGGGVLGSIYGGVDYQVLPRAVVGVLAEASLASFQTSSSAQVPGASAVTNTNAGLGWSVLARAGVLANPSTLLYLVGGYTGQNFNTNGTAVAGGSVASFSRDETVHGWTIGPGFETMLTGGWSTKLEYRYSQFGTTTVPGTNINITPSTHAARIGLSYKFGGLAVPAYDEPATAYRPEKTNWTGIYGGVAGGGGVAVTNVTTAFGGASTATTSAGQGLLGSVFAGADYQFAPQALVGILGDFTWAGLQSTASLTAGGSNATVASNPNRAWSVMGRVGYLPIPSTLLYAAGGYAGQNVTSTATASVGGANAFAQQDNTFHGWTVGPGIETVVTGGWTTRLEYRYSQFQQQQVLNGVGLQPSTHTIRAGLAYKFGIGSPSPSVASE